MMMMVMMKKMKQMKVDWNVSHFSAAFDFCDSRGVGSAPSLFQMEHASAEACATVLKSQGLMQSFGKAWASGCETWHLMIFMVISW